MNATIGSCYIVLQIPHGDDYVPAITTTFIRFSSGGVEFYAATCHSKAHGDVPGYQWEGLCYYEYKSQLLSSTRYSLVGIINGSFKFSRVTYTCNVFGGYQVGFKEPLFYCVARHGNFVIPGKLDHVTKTCWYLNTSSKTFYAILAA